MVWKDVSGNYLIGSGKLNFLDSKYKEPRKSKIYNFSRFSNGITSSNIEDNDDSKSNKFNYKNIDFSDLDRSDEIDPIQTNTTDSSYLFDNEDAIVVNFKKFKK